MQQAFLLGVGGAGALMGCCMGTWPGLLGALSVLGWTAVEAGEAGLAGAQGAAGPCRAAPRPALFPACPL